MRGDGVLFRCCATFCGFLRAILGAGDLAEYRTLNTEH
jgi:hypothetical protein